MQSELIRPMAYSLVRDAICQLVANKRDEQIKIALDMGLTPNQIARDIDFTIYPKRFRVPNVEDMPCVYIYFNKTDFEQVTMDENYALSTLCVDYYCSGENLNNLSADENACNRLDYLTAQLYNILLSECNLINYTNKIVDHQRLKTWELILVPDELNQIATVLGASFKIELGFYEPLLKGTLAKIKEYYISLGINDKFIDPFVRVLLDSKNKER